MGNKETVAVIPSTVETSALTPDLMAAVVGVLDLRWSGCQVEFEQHQAVGHRDLVAAALVISALDRDVSPDAVLMFLRGAAEEMGVTQALPALQRAVKLFEQVMSRHDSVPDADVCQALQEEASATRFNESLSARVLGHATAAAIWLRAKEADPDYNANVAVGFVDATIAIVHDIMELAGPVDADRFISRLRSWVDTSIRTGTVLLKAAANGN